MGLDITHYKATLDRPEDINPLNTPFVILDEFEGFDVDSTYFQESIQCVDVPEVLKTLIIVKNEDEIDEVKKLLYDDITSFLFDRDKSKIDIMVSSFINENKSSGSMLHKWETDKWLGINIFMTRKKNGFYFEEVGYARKGMNGKFREKFLNKEVFRYTKLDDFKYARECVDYYWRSDTRSSLELRRNEFQKNFIDKYEVNKSWMELNY